MYFVSIGNFDGVHAGHQRILKELVQQAKLHNSHSLVITFDPHPRSILNPDLVIKALQSVNERVDTIKRLGVDEVRVLRFDKEILQLLAVEFLGQYVGLEDLAGMVEGQNFRFGRRGTCDIACLKILGYKYNFKVVSVSLVEKDGEILSSTRLRQSLE